MLPVRVCLPTGAVHPPDGPEWLHEIKHDGFRMIARRDGERVRLISRRGLDWGDRFGTIVAAVETLAVRSCVIDGEAIVCDGDGLPSLRVRSNRTRRPRSPARADSDPQGGVGAGPRCLP